jgi:hypothetical protein
MGERTSNPADGYYSWHWKIARSVLGLVLLSASPISLPVAAQNLDCVCTPLPQESLGLESQFSSTVLSEFQGTSQRQSSPQPQAPQKNQGTNTQKGTSNDRILWTLPNFLTVENADSIPPLTPGQKFKVVARGVFDPFEFVLIGFVAGLGQASDSNPSYGQGMQGYAKRYGTSYADNAIENFMASAVFPSVLHQDPRYYQLGHGGFVKRAGHAVSRVLMTRSDSGDKQLNYSELVGGLSAAAISTYTYHPQSERGFGNVVSVWGSQMGWDAVTYMIKEFWPDLRKRSKNRRNDVQATGQN